MHLLSFQEQHVYVERQAMLILQLFNALLVIHCVIVAVDLQTQTVVHALHPIIGFFKEQLVFVMIFQWKLGCLHAHLQVARQATNRLDRQIARRFVEMDYYLLSNVMMGTPSQVTDAHPLVLLRLISTALEGTRPMQQSAHTRSP